MLKTNLVATYRALDVRNAASSIMARAKRILGATTASRRSKILLRIVTSAKGMENSLSAVHRTSADGLARDEIELLKNRNAGYDTSAALLKTTRVEMLLLLEIVDLLRNKDNTLNGRSLATFTCGLIGDERFISPFLVIGVKCFPAF